LGIIKVFSEIGMGICQKDNVKPTPNNIKMHRRVTIKNDFIIFSVLFRYK